MRLNKYLAAEPLDFDGSQLRPGWARERFGAEGESVVVFTGIFRPAPGEGAFPPGCELFRGRRLLHVVIEHEHQDVEKLRLQQRLLLDVTKDKLNHRLHGDLIQRWRQDLCTGSAHLSLSTVLLTAVSAIIYLGILIQNDAPEPKLWGLRDGQIDPRELAGSIIDQYVFEVENARQPIG